MQRTEHVLHAKLNVRQNLHCCLLSNSMLFFHMIACSEKAFATVRFSVLFFFFFVQMWPSDSAWESSSLKNEQLQPIDRWSTIEARMKFYFHHVVRMVWSRMDASPSQTLNYFFLLVPSSNDPSLDTRLWHRVNTIILVELGFDACESIVECRNEQRGKSHYFFRRKTTIIFDLKRAAQQWNCTVIEKRKLSMVIEQHSIATQATTYRSEE